MYIGLNGNYKVGQIRTLLLNLAITLCFNRSWYD